MLTVSELAFEYPEKQLFQGIGFELKQGRLLHLRGPNGSGKTTLLKLIAGLLSPSEGIIRYEEPGEFEEMYEKAGGSCGAKADVENDLPKFCFIGYRNGLNPLLTIRENCQFDPQWEQCVMPLASLLKQFNLAGLEDVPCHQLSAGQKRRVGLLRLGMTKAKLWLCDEPFVALDQSTVQLLLSYFKQHLLRGGQIVLASHYPLPTDWDHFIQFFDLTCV